MTKFFDLFEKHSNFTMYYKGPKTLPWEKKCPMLFSTENLWRRTRIFH